MYFNLIGGGRLGKALALALTSTGTAMLKTMCNKHYHNAELAIAQIGMGRAVATLSDLAPAELTFITTPDDLIPQIAQRLAEEKDLQPGSIVAHCSGVLSTEALSPLSDLGCHLASIHPLKAIRGNLVPNIFTDCLCAIDGDPDAVAKLKPLFTHLGAKVVDIHSEGKTAYHAAAVFASNYLVTLAATAMDLFAEAGINQELAQEMTTTLMRSSLSNLEQTRSVADALTGPLLRGDYNTLAKHLSALKKRESKHLYCAAALASLPLAKLSEEQQRELRALLLSPAS